MIVTEHNPFAGVETDLWRAEYLHKAFTVFYNRKLQQGVVKDGQVEVLSKANAELRAKLGKEPILVTGPVVTYNAIEIDAENEEAAAAAAVHLYGANASEGELKVAETTNVKGVVGV